MKLFKSYTDICTARGIDPVASLPFPVPADEIQVSTNGCFKLQQIFAAFNGDWKADYTNQRQWKYYPWHVFNPAVGGFVFTDTHCTCTATGLGAHLCTDTDAKAVYIAKQFNTEWNEFLNPKL